MNSEKLKVVIVKTGENAVVSDLSPDDDMYGLLMSGELKIPYIFSPSKVALVGINGDGQDLPRNRVLSRSEDGSVFDIISGDFMVVGYDEGFYSLTNEQASVWKRTFLMPNRFVDGENGLEIIPYQQF